MVQMLPDDFDFDAASGGRSRHDWDTLLNGRGYKLTKGVDFYSDGETGTCSQFAAYIRNTAKSDRFPNVISAKVVVTEEEDGTEVVLIKAVLMK